MNNETNNKMNSVELLKKVCQAANEEKKRLTKSYFNGDKSYYKQQLSKNLNCYFNGDVYETINNLSSAYAKSLNY